ncbi:50S ribosomal protein L25 [Desulfosporosinus fructosivorans]|uniref:50S ribosomal protein L25 n=1 Tax=Desulfosporosinus fructosivorans TaxID=2018669 RepID=A0A4Z0R3E9_9FIRM|nr:50S ribosomal protein L25 [Desulfosporosinus fructosivorans]TGE37562.1 50S ribosomal protein L25 [Desulfosporosinus fructosivorans]
MEETILAAVERTMQPKLCRAAGFTPGVLYGDSVTDAISVQFDTAVLKKVIAAHGWNAKVWVDFGGNRKFGFIKEVQRDSVTAKVIHIDVFLVSQDHEVKMIIPVIFEGRDNLDNVLLQVYKSEIEVTGKAVLMPESFVVDVSAMVLGDTITSASFNLDKQLTITESENEIYGIITPLPELVVEPETVVAVETPTKTPEA